MSWLLARLVEPSTWAGFGAAAAGANASGGISNPTFWLSILGGIAAVLVPEGGAAK